MSLLFTVFLRNRYGALTLEQRTVFGETTVRGQLLWGQFEEVLSKHDGQKARPTVRRCPAAESSHQVEHRPCTHTQNRYAANASGNGTNHPLNWTSAQ